MSIKKIADVLKIYGSFLISTHINPEGDSLGSQLGLYQLLEAMGKKAVMVNDHKVPPVYEFLPKSNLIRNRLDKTIDYDVAIVIDCPHLERIGRVKEILKEDKMILNIDHHISNTNFGKINWVNAKASACGEMVYDLYKELDCKIDKDIATNIYTAILNDTGSFGYSNTTSRVHTIASELLGCGLEVSKIKEAIYDAKGLDEIKLLGLALSTLGTSDEGKIAYMSVTRDMAKECGIELKGTEEFVNFPRSIKGAKVALFFREEKNGLIHVSFRSKSEIDVNKIASAFGGGGHMKAAGCLIKAKVDEAKEKVLAEIRKEFSGEPKAQI
jgi:phosphoesterase RecJ-like protein